MPNIISSIAIDNHHDGHLDEEDSGSLPKLMINGQYKSNTATQVNNTMISGKQDQEGPVSTQRKRKSKRKKVPRYLKQDFPSQNLHMVRINAKKALDLPESPTAH